MGNTNKFILRKIFRMRNFSIKLLALAFVLFLTVKSEAQNPINWTEEQLIQPADLADAIITKKNVPIIISVGPGSTIANSIDVGMVNNAEGLQKLKAKLSGMNKEEKLVIYCGCCPFEHCPNVRPAINVLKEMNFTNYFLLNLPNNVKKDWIDKGYPVTKSGAKN